jgi:hypothetical protein
MFATMLIGVIAAGPLSIPLAGVATAKRLGPGPTKAMRGINRKELQ